MMSTSAAVLLALSSVVAQAAGPNAAIVVSDPEGAAGRVAAPAALEVDLKNLLADAEPPARLELVEVTGASGLSSRPTAVDFEPEGAGSTRGTLWWLMPPGPKGERQFRLRVGAEAGQPSLSADYEATRQRVDLAEGGARILRYNHGTVPPPPETADRFERGGEPPLHYARGGYVHPLYGPHGEEITDDYSLNHPHRRGMFWAWPGVGRRRKRSDGVFPGGGVTGRDGSLGARGQPGLSELSQSGRARWDSRAIPALALRSALFPRQRRRSKARRRLDRLRPPARRPHSSLRTRLPRGGAPCRIPLTPHPAEISSRRRRPPAWPHPLSCLPTCSPGRGAPVPTTGSRWG